MYIAIDLDGTIAKWTDKAIERAKDYFDVDIIKEEIKSFRFADDVKAQFLKNNGKPLNIDDDKIYELLCGEDFYISLDPMEEAIDTVKEIYKAGHKIIFLTKPTDWKLSSYQKVEWLKKYFNDIEYNVIMVSSMESKCLVNVHIIVDDDPRALTNHSTAIPICVAQPWNKDFREKGSVGMIIINKLSELPKQIEFINDLLNREEPILN